MLIFEGGEEPSSTRGETVHSEGRKVKGGEEERVAALAAEQPFGCLVGMHQSSFLLQKHNENQYFLHQLGGN